MNETPWIQTTFLVRSRCRWEANRNWILSKWSVKVLTEFIWQRISSSGGIYCTRHAAFILQWQKREIFRLAGRVTIVSLFHVIKYQHTCAQRHEDVQEKWKQAQIRAFGHEGDWLCVITLHPPHFWVQGGLCQVGTWTELSGHRVWCGEVNNWAHFW